MVERKEGTEPSQNSAGTSNDDSQLVAYLKGQIEQIKQEALEM